MNSQSRLSILNKIKLANTTCESDIKTHIPFDTIFKNNESGNLLETFIKNFEKVSGNFIDVKQAQLNNKLIELIQQKNWRKIFVGDDPLKLILERLNIGLEFTTRIIECDVSFTYCELAVARTGSFVFSSALNYGRSASVYAPEQVTIFYENQIVQDETTALVALKQKYPNQFPSSVSFATGPSRTADIEKTLVVGIHGPKAVYALLLNSQDDS